MLLTKIPKSDTYLILPEICAYPQSTKVLCIKGFWHMQCRGVTIFFSLPSLSERFFSSFSHDKVCAPRVACKFSICRSKGLVADVTLWLSSWLRVSASWSLWNFKRDKYHLCSRKPWVTWKFLTGNTTQRMLISVYMQCTVLSNMINIAKEDKFCYWTIMLIFHTRTLNWIQVPNRSVHSILSWSHLLWAWSNCFNWETDHADLPGLFWSY